MSASNRLASRRALRGAPARGYAIVNRSGERNILRRATEVAPGERVETRLARERLPCTVDKVLQKRPAGALTTVVARNTARRHAQDSLHRAGDCCAMLAMTQHRRTRRAFLPGLK